jgi:hypothetical protein
MYVASVPDYSNSNFYAHYSLITCWIVHWCVHSLSRSNTAVPPHTSVVAMNLFQSCKLWILNSHWESNANNECLQTWIRICTYSAVLYNADQCSWFLTECILELDRKGEIWNVFGEFHTYFHDPYRHNIS